MRFHQEVSITTQVLANPRVMSNPTFYNDIFFGCVPILHEKL